MELAMRRQAGLEERGMGLIEVLIALTILAFALLGLMPLFIGAVKTSASANQLTSANTLAREKLEELTGYPRNDQRLTIAAGANAAVPTGGTISGATVAVNAFCNNDLPNWYNPCSGEVSFAPPPPSPPPTTSLLPACATASNWYSYPYVRTYTVEALAADVATRVTAPSPYVVKRLIVTVTPRQGPFPGLRTTTQSLFLRSPNV
jgi:prepilin-type N-terminal cleavage/methylation domain-containing protein